VLHWHGIRVPAEMDGTHLMQRPIEPGGSFEYRFAPPDAGTYWYHSHINEPEQMERGLYGALIVRGEGEPRLDAERVLVFDDLLLGETGALSHVEGFTQEGREGAVLLINGREHAELDMAAGQVERWRVVNAASARPIRLSIGGSEFQILGSDGGLLPEPISATDVLLTPGERVDLAVGPFEEDASVAINSLPYSRGTSELEEVDRFGVVRVGAPAPSNVEIPTPLNEIEPLVDGPVEANRTVRLGANFSPQGVEWLINDERDHTDVPVRVGELQVWDIVNETRMAHPFHLHGFFFQVLEENGVPAETIAWKDTVHVPGNGTVRIAWVPDDRPGRWMYHCHILGHHAGGMMATFDVVY
jgi:FtsP/CotA-like multicopper oxidase with cupredoxin domain